MTVSQIIIVICFLPVAIWANVILISSNKHRTKVIGALNTFVTLILMMFLVISCLMMPKEPLKLPEPRYERIIIPAVKADTLYRKIGIH